MKVLHIMKAQKFTNGVSEFYAKYFHNGEHEIGYINYEGKPTLIREDLALTQQEVYFGKHPFLNMRRFARMVKGYDRVVFHSYLHPFWLRAFLAFSPRILHRVVWIEWGADLYEWRGDGNNLLAKMMRAADKKIRTACAAVVCIFQPDMAHYRREFPTSQVPVFYAPYCSANVTEEYTHYDPSVRLEQTVREEDTVHIQIGHSATPQVGHMDVLRMLERFADRNIQLLIPLNYGDAAYADEVQRYAEEHFPGKTRCLREMLPRDEYFELTKRVDIAVFHSFRQIALGNLHRFVFRNVKVYLPNDSVMYTFFKEKGVPVQASEDLAVCDFETLKQVPQSDNTTAFADYIAEFTTMDWKVRAWETVYDAVRTQEATKR